MLNDNSELLNEEEVLKRLRQISTQHMIVAYRANMSNHEILLCQKISAMSKIPLIDVLEKMEAFKQTSEHILYKRDFMFF
ncbi:hypothetical protein [Sulfuricurvum sp.]|uniref:hypothetical protein n=1 Tax=Sulfuricurvum sp. TaxID=2025608 RepID=UPI0025FDEF60|nr:hypothetical protein [Sulfuricurvum sp.]